jgi:regulator of replication initiation timing
MSTILEIVDSLENRVSKLLHQHNKQKAIQEELIKEVSDLRAEQAKFLEEIELWREKYNTMKVANSMLGSDQYKRETKLKINSLVREIDQCINQLSE